MKKNYEASSNSVKQTFTIRSMCIMAILSALSAAIMIFEFPLPIIAPSFYEVDFSSSVIMLGAFSLGTLPGIIMEIFKMIISLFIKPSTSAFVGEFASLIIELSFIITASLIFHRRRTVKTALIGLGAGAVIMAIVAGFANYFVIIPMYENLFGLPLSQIIAAGAAITPAIDNLFTFVLLATIPFNLIKSIFNSIIVLILYKRLRPVLYNFTRRK